MEEGGDSSDADAKVGYRQVSRGDTKRSMASPSRVNTGSPLKFAEQSTSGRRKD